MTLGDPAPRRDFEDWQVSSQPLNDKQRGLERRFEVKKLTNPDKVIDSIVMEFDDYYARIALRAYIAALKQDGFKQYAQDIEAKLAV
jgi:hypothetical protein